MADERDILQKIRSTLHNVDFDSINTGSWFGHVLADLQLAVGDGTVVHVDWEAQSDPNDDFRAKVVVVTEKAVIVATYDQEADIAHSSHSAFVRSRRRLEDIQLSSSLPFMDHNSPEVVTATLNWSDTSTLLLPLSKSTRINESLKALIPSLLKDVAA